MEYMQSNLLRFISASNCLDGVLVKSILFQGIQGLEHIHAHHFIHCDIKPENILISPCRDMQTYVVKIADFGEARKVKKHSNSTYFGTRWYRAPELLLGQTFSTGVDIWAVGAIAAELVTGKPLFPGESEVDQLSEICNIIGSPGYKHSGGPWQEAAKGLGFSFPNTNPRSLDKILQASLSQLVSWCLKWDPKSRPTSTQALNHEYFADIDQELVCE